LPAALAELLAFWRSVRPETAFRLDCEIWNGQLSDAVKECLFRAAQEGVSNAVRHGRPANVIVRLGQQESDAVLTVQDDGLGGVENPGRGLPGMRSRAAFLGGSVALARGPGWTLTVTVPLAPMPPAIAAVNAEAVSS
jgi:two-component system sensor histidine kinase UhpB